MSINAVSSQCDLLLARHLWHHVLKDLSGFDYYSFS